MTITRGTSPVAEGTGASFTVTASPAPLANLSVSLTVADAAAGDFVAAGNEGAKHVTIPPSGSATYTVATVPDHTDEANGEVTVTVVDGDGYTVGTAASAAVTLTDDDPTVVSLVRTGGTTGALTEGATVGLVVSLGRSLVAGETVDVPLAVSGTGVTTGDWSLAEKAGTGLNTGVTLSGETTATPKVRFSGAGARTATLVLTTVEDAVDEPTAETYTVALGPDGAVANGFDVTTLATNVGGGADPHATHNAFSVDVRDGVELAWAPGSLTVDEGAGTARLALELSASRAVATPVTIFYGSSGATSPQDYRRGPSRVTIAAGATRATVDIPIVDDALVEEDELFLAAIDTGRLPPDVVVAGSGDYALITIRDNESDPVVTLAAASTAVLTEGTAARFTLSVAPASGPALAVNLQVADAPGADFVAAAGEGGRTVTVPAGAASADFTVATADDRTDEPSGEVTVTLAAGEGYGRREGPPAQVRVRDDDPTQVTLSTPDATTTEGDPHRHRRHRARARAGLARGRAPLGAARVLGRPGRHRLHPRALGEPAGGGPERHHRGLHRRRHALGGCGDGACDRGRRRRHRARDGDGELRHAVPDRARRRRDGAALGRRAPHPLRRRRHPAACGLHRPRRPRHRGGARHLYAHREPRPRHGAHGDARRRRRHGERLRGARRRGHEDRHPPHHRHRHRHRRHGGRRHAGVRRRGDGERRLGQRLHRGHPRLGPRSPCATTTAPRPRSRC